VKHRYGAWVAVLAACGQGSASVEQAREGALREYAIALGPSRTVQVPPALKEISGLAATADGRYLGHNDEIALVYELDPEHGGVIKSFRLGEAPEAADFEGIAVVGGRVFLMTSDGVLYSGPEGADRQSVPYEKQATGLGARCELEGLAFEPAGRILLIPCKRPHDRSREDSVVVFRWSVDRRALASPASIAIPRRELTRHLSGKDFRPSAIERHPVSGTYFLLSANERALAEITPTGEIVAVRELPKEQHRQPEGIAFTPDLALVIADEGKESGQLTVYRRSPPLE